MADWSWGPAVDEGGPHCSGMLQRSPRILHPSSRVRKFSSALLMDTSPKTRAPWSHGDFRWLFLGLHIFRQEKPSIGARRTRLNTAKDEKISSRSIVFQYGRGGVVERRLTEQKALGSEEHG